MNLMRAANNQVEQDHRSGHTGWFTDPQRLGQYEDKRLRRSGWIAQPGSGVSQNLASSAHTGSALRSTSTGRPRCRPRGL